MDEGQPGVGRYSRRRFLQVAAVAAVGRGTPRGSSSAARGRAWPPFFLTRGVVLNPAELEAMDCPALAKRWGLNSFDLAHHSHWVVGTKMGRRALADCRRLGITVEFGFHAVSAFLPRDLFARDPTMFRMDESGQRVPDANLCPHSEAALEILCENAVKHADLVRPTSSRYHYWLDDGQPMCRCPQCRGLSDSEQALLVEHRLLKALRRGDPRATLAHLAYQRTLPPPVQVKPEKGIFLQFAPFDRDSLRPLSHRDASQGPGRLTHGRLLDLLDANLSVFPRESAHVLEYWLDNSRFSGWRPENVRKVPWRPEVFLDDLRTYATRGIRHMWTYAFWFDADYVRRYGLPPLDEYGAGLLRWRYVRGKPVEVAPEV